MGYFNSLTKENEQANKRTKKQKGSILCGLLPFWNTLFFLTKAVDLENNELGSRKVPSYPECCVLFSFFFSTFIRPWQVRCRQVRTLVTGSLVSLYFLPVSTGCYRQVSWGPPRTVLSMLWHLWNCCVYLGAVCTTALGSAHTDVWAYENLAPIAKAHG